MKQLGDFVIAYKLVWLRVFFYFFIPAATLFLTQTETWDQPTWDALGSFLRFRLIMACVIAGSASLAAYLDSSLQRAREHSAELKKERDTQIWKKEDTGP